MFLLSLLICFGVLNSAYSSQRDEERKCTFTATGEEGICVPVLKCPDIILQIRKGVRPQLCSPDIVCCVKSNETKTEDIADRIIDDEKPTTQTNTNTNITDRMGANLSGKSKRKCKEYERLVMREFVDPVALYETHVHKYDSCKRAFTSIVGGQEADREEFPHMAIIKWNENPKRLCSGSIISDYFILTAAHCLETSNKPSYVLLGVHMISKVNSDTNVQRIDIEKQLQPVEKRSNKYDDIGLLKLKQKILFSTAVRPACLYTEDTIQTNTLIASGWGKIYFGGPNSDVLKKVNLFLNDNDKCNAKWQENITVETQNLIPNGIISSQLCANSPDGNDTCSGDSGGPLQLKTDKCIYHIVGVVSFGSYCGTPHPAVYTRVSKFVKWIEDNVWPN